MGGSVSHVAFLDLVIWGERGFQHVAAEAFDSKLEEVLVQHSSGGFLEEALERSFRDDEAEAFGAWPGDAFAHGIIGRAMKPSGDLIDFVLGEACEGWLFSWFSHEFLRERRLKSRKSTGYKVSWGY